MELTNRELFAQALCEAMSREYREELADCTETAECSMAHYRKMSKILGYNVVPKSRVLSLKAKFAVAILAAVLLLVGCTAVIFRNEIKDLFENVFDTFISVTYDEEFDGKGAIINEYYKLSYLPGDYVLDNEMITSIQAVYKYRDASGNILKFEQTLVDGSQYTFDINSEGTLILECGEKTIYHRNAGEYYHYAWNDGVYTFRITSQYELTKDEIKTIINGITS